jgi:hypothetical protein
MITWVVFLRMVWNFISSLPVKRGGSLSFFDHFHFWRSRVIGLDMTENRMFTLCRMITWVVFLRTFWNFISSLLVKRGGSLSFFDNFHFCRKLVLLRAQLTKIYPPLPTSVQPISITKTLLIVPTKNERKIFV